MVLWQTRTEAHSNEITAIPGLLRVLELKGCLVSIDAMGCQKAIVLQVVTGGADCLLAVKANQGELHENIGPFQGQEAGRMAAGCAARRWARPVKGSLADQRPQTPRSSVIATLRRRSATVPR